MKDAYTTHSHYVTYAFLFKFWEDVLIELRSERVNPFPPRVINVKFPLQPHQKYNTTQHKELGLVFLAFSQ